MHQPEAIHVLILEGFQFIGFELDPQYAAIANARIEAARASMTEIG